jgi:PAS domain S-box-containing protein
MNNLLKADQPPETFPAIKPTYEELVIENENLRNQLKNRSVSEETYPEIKKKSEENGFNFDNEGERQHKYLVNKLLGIRNSGLNGKTANRNTVTDYTAPGFKLTEMEVFECLELNKSLLKSIPFGINIVDEEGTILFQNEYFKKNLKIEAIGQKCWNTFREDNTQCLSCPLLKGIKPGKSDSCEIPGILGGIYQISFTGMIYQGKKAMMEIFRDITEKNEIKKKVKLLAHSLKSITDCISITDQEDRIIYINDAFLTTYGYSESELIGQSISIVRPMEMEHVKVRDILPKTIDGGWRGEIMNKKKDGTLFPVLLSTSAIKDENGKLVALIGVAMDISEQRKKREELLEAKAVAEESNRLKSALLNNLSHEIRTPMNAIMGFSSLLQEADDEEKKMYADIIRKSSNHLLKMIDDVILISRLQSEKMSLNIYDCIPAEIVNHVYQVFQHADLNKGLKIKLSIPENSKNLIIRSDEDKIMQILTNLVSNAVKYTLEGSVEIGMSVHDCVVEFFVEDTGMGIPKKELPKIFDNFYRGEQALNYAIRGNGLGLCITKELVELMGGTISVQSEVKKGSRFYFTVPFKSSVNPDLIPA